MTILARPATADEQLVRNASAAFARGDIDAAVADLHPEVEWIETDSFPDGGRYLGRDAVHSYLTNSRAGWLERLCCVELRQDRGKLES